MILFYWEWGIGTGWLTGSTLSVNISLIILHFCNMDHRSSNCCHGNNQWGSHQTANRPLFEQSIKSCTQSVHGTYCDLISFHFSYLGWSKCEWVSANAVGWKHDSEAEYKTYWPAESNPFYSDISVLNWQWQELVLWNCGWLFCERIIRCID